MKLLAVLSFLLITASFILTMLSIFAGHKQGFLENADLMTLNVSMLGENLLNTSSIFGSSKPDDDDDDDGKDGDSVLGRIGDRIQDLGQDAKDKIGDKIQDGINSAVNYAAEKLNIHDFYAAHLMTYCEGYYAPTPTGNATVQPWKNTTRCSNATAMFSFDPTRILQDELRAGVNISDLKWPQEIEDAITAVQAAVRAMFILFCIGAGLAGVGVIGAVAAVFSSGRLSAVLNFVVDLLAFLSLGIASAIATAIVVKLTDGVNEHGAKIGIAAYRGQTFMIMTWLATALALVAAVVWIVDCCVGRRRRTVTSYRDGKASRI